MARLAVGSMSIGLMSMATAWALGAVPASAYTLVSQQDHFLIELPAAPQLEKDHGDQDGVPYDQRAWSVQQDQKGWVVVVAAYQRPVVRH